MKVHWLALTGTVLIVSFVLICCRLNPREGWAVVTAMFVVPFGVVSLVMGASIGYLVVGNFLFATLWPVFGVTALFLSIDAARLDGGAMLPMALFGAGIVGLFPWLTVVLITSIIQRRRGTRAKRCAWAHRETG